ncbi:MAG: translation elongation factor Ts, partial [Candidatus Riflebacteria bacterium RBG_13_59_9]
RTSVGLMECKKALVKVDGDIEKAVDLLRVQGLAMAAKKAGRTANEGAVAAWVNAKGDAGLVLEVNCETDFVARTDDFRALVQDLVANFAASAYLAQSGLYEDVEALLASPFYRDSSRTIRDIIGDVVGKTGENIQLGRFGVINLSGRNARVQLYEHAGGRVTSLVGIEAGKPETLKNEKFLSLAKDLAMQVAAGMPRVPVAVKRDEVPEDILEEEKRIYHEQTLAEGKPENLVDKIVMGRLNKFFKEVVLLEQPFIKEEKQSVQGIIDGVAKELGEDIAPVMFFRFAIGD